MQATLVTATFFAAGRTRDLRAPAVALLVGCSLIAVTAEAASQRGTDPPLDRSATGLLDRGLALLTGIGLLVVWLLSLLHVGPTSPIGRAHAIGAAMLVAGAAVRCVAVRALGQRFVTAARPRGALQVSGIYRWVRHPSETGLLAMGAGAALFAEGAISPWIVLAVVLVPSSLLRVRREDRELARVFAGEHRRYVASVGALLPRW